MFGDLDAAEAWVDNWEASLQERADQARRLRERLEAATGVGWDRDRVVRVTVGDSGAVTDVDLGEEILRQPVATTRAQILEAARAAQADLADQAAQITAETIGTGHPTADAVIASYKRRAPEAGDTDAAR